MGSRLDSIVLSVNDMIKACDEVRNSELLRKLIAMILTLGNHINTGGSGNAAAGFSLKALIELDNAKAFDKKTSVLHYLVTLIKKNDKSVLDFKEELPSIELAEKVALGSVKDETQEFNGELKETSATIKNMLGDICASDNTKSELKDKDPKDESSEKKNGAKHPMEQFLDHAESSIKDAFTRIDAASQKYQRILEYFGEDDKMNSAEFFGTIK